MTACPHCGANLHERVRLGLPTAMFMFAETYECGAVLLWGSAPEDVNRRLTPCPSEGERGEPSNSTPLGTVAP